MRLDLHDTNNQHYSRKIAYWKKVLVSLRKDYTKDNDKDMWLSDSGFRKWLFENWNIKLLFRNKRSRNKTEEMKYQSAVTRIKYIHDIVVTRETLTLLMLKYPSDLIVNELEKVDDN